MADKTNVVIHRLESIVAMCGNLGVMIELAPQPRAILGGQVDCVPLPIPFLTQVHVAVQIDGRMQH